MKESKDLHIISENTPVKLPGNSSDGLSEIKKKTSLPRPLSFKLSFTVSKEAESVLSGSPKQTHNLRFPSTPGNKRLSSPHNRKKKRKISLGEIPYNLISLFNRDTYHHGHNTISRDSLTNDAFETVLCMWSKSACRGCSHFALDEEIMSCWTDIDIEKSIPCLTCGNNYTPTLKYRVYDSKGFEPEKASYGAISGFDISGEVVYLSPHSLRLQLEWLILSKGEQVLYRENLRCFHPPIYYNLVWYCTRLHLPLPLPGTHKHTHTLSLSHTHSLLSFSLSPPLFSLSLSLSLSFSFSLSLSLITFTITRCKKFRLSFQKRESITRF